VILEARNLKKRYRSRGRVVEAVRGVSLTLARGEVLAFLGPNGAGKTTTIKMISGLIVPDAGEVRIEGENPHANPRVLARVGSVLEGNRNLYWRLTPIENLEYFGVLKGLAPAEARRRGLALLERFGLLEKKGALVQQLSRGMQQKLAIAVALVHTPALLLLDEPTLGLDVEAAASVQALIREIAAEGQAILLTTHQLDVAEALSDRVAIIQKGRIVAEERTEALIERFSGDFYEIELAEAVDPARAGRLSELGAWVEDGVVRYRGEAQGLWAVLEVLRGLTLVRVERDKADLTEVFLKLIAEGSDVGAVSQ